MTNARLMHVTTVGMSLMFLRGQVAYVQARGLEVRAVSSPGEELERFGADEAIVTHAVPMPRRLSPLADLVAVARLWKTMRRWRPHVVHAHTPKAGLLGMIAAWLARVPVRIYHVRGLPFMTARGPKRQLLRGTERVACRLAHRVLCVSHSIRDVVVADRLCPPQKARVLAGGSGNGVDAAGRFNPDNYARELRETVRETRAIPTDALVAGFVGRLVRDKGIVELAAAWRHLRECVPNLHLLVVGPTEERDPVPAEVLEALRSDRRVHVVGKEWNTPPLYAAMDLVVLPTYREGFPNVPLEAAAMRLPVVATRVPGCVDAVCDGETGLLVPAGDADALAEAMLAYLRDGELRRRHGHAARQRVLREFRQEVIWEATYEEYRRLAEERGLQIAASYEAEAKPPASRRLYLLLKRVMDVAVAASALFVLSPLIAAVAATVAIAMGRPVLFRQLRPGYRGRPFHVRKFRSMRQSTGPDGNPLPDAARLTRLGRFLRSASLDELPQLWNVLVGEMSLVGPRPLLMEYLSLYTPEQARRHEVRPGITGWAQVNGRNALSWDEKFQLDVWYVNHCSLLLDLRILLMTLRRVLLREGVNQSGHATMEPFRGSLPESSDVAQSCARAQAVRSEVAEAEETARAL